MVTALKSSVAIAVREGVAVLTPVPTQPGPCGLLWPRASVKFLSLSRRSYGSAPLSARADRPFRTAIAASRHSRNRYAPEPERITPSAVRHLPATAPFPDGSSRGSP